MRCIGSPALVLGPGGNSADARRGSLGWRSSTHGWSRPGVAIEAVRAGAVKKMRAVASRQMELRWEWRMWIMVCVKGDVSASEVEGKIAFETS